MNLHMRFNSICENFIQCAFFIRLIMSVSLFACFYYGDHCDAKVNRIALL